MSYSFKIGNAEIDCDLDDGYIGLIIKEVRHDNAPAFGEPLSDFINCRCPDYTDWREFCEFTFLTDLFYENCGGILRDNPGIILLTRGHQKEINDAYQNFFKKYPHSKPGFETDSEPDRWHVRLVWLKYWVDWAIENCGYPAFQNS